MEAARLRRPGGADAKAQRLILGSGVWRVLPLAFAPRGEK